jgi:hypothetical protein
MSDPAVRLESDRSRRPDLADARPACAGEVKQGRRPPRQRRVLDRTEHAGILVPVGNTTRAVVRNLCRVSNLLVAEHLELAFDPLLQIATTPAHDAVALRSRTLLDPSGQFGFLLGREAGAGPGARRFDSPASPSAL